MFPVLGREVVEGEQGIAIFDQALDRLVVFYAPDFDEGVERRQRVALGLSHPDLLQRPLRLGVLGVGQLVEDVGRLVHPAALPAGLRPHFLDRLPEAERAVGNRELGADRESTSLQIEEQLSPRLRTRTPSIRPTSSFLPSGVAPMMTSRHCAASSSLACTWMPSAQKYT